MRAPRAVRACKPSVPDSILAAENNASAGFPLPACGERDRVRGLFEFGFEHFQNALDVAENVVVPDANDTIATRGEIGITDLVGTTAGVLPAIDLDDQLPFATDEVDIVGSHRLLAGELKGAEPPIAQPKPQHHLHARTPTP